VHLLREAAPELQVVHLVLRHRLQHQVRAREADAHERVPRLAQLARDAQRLRARARAAGFNTRLGAAVPSLLRAQQTSGAPHNRRGAHCADAPSEDAGLERRLRSAHAGGPSRLRINEPISREAAGHEQPAASVAGRERNCPERERWAERSAQWAQGLRAGGGARLRLVQLAVQHAHCARGAAAHAARVRQQQSALLRLPQDVPAARAGARPWAGMCRARA